MRVKIYVEGGGDSPATIVKCRSGFAEFFSKMLPEKAKVRVIPQGGRQATYDAYCTSLETSEDGEISILLVDAEEPVQPGTSVWDHLRQREGDRWTKPPTARSDDAHLMVQTIESWFLADPDKLREYYGKGFKIEKLPVPVNDRDVECHSKATVYKGLKSATRTSVRKKYEKSDAFEIIGKIDPDKICAVSEHARKLRDKLKSILQAR